MAQAKRERVIVRRQGWLPWQGRGRALAPRLSHQPRVRGLRAKHLGSSGLVQLRVDRARRLGRELRHALELLLRGGEEALGRAEVAEDRPPAGRPDALEGVEDRLERLRVAA